MKPIRLRQLGVLTLGVAFVLAVATVSTPTPQIRFPSPGRAASPPAPRPPNPAEALRRARARIEPELARAEAEARDAIATRLRPVDALFEAARRGLPRFADRALGWESRLAVVTDRLPWSSGRDTARVLRAAFHACVLDPEQLEQAAGRAVAETLAAFQEIDDALLVRLRADLDDLPAPAPRPIVGRDRLLADVTTSTAAATAACRPELARAVALEVAAILASEAVTGAVLRSAAASGLAGAVTLSGPMSLGVGLAAGLAADRALSWAIDRWVDPRGTLIRLLDAQLTELRRRVLRGSAREPGLRPRLEQLARDRAAARRTRILETLGAPTREATP